jgi:hypothetical protein
MRGKCDFGFVFADCSYFACNTNHIYFSVSGEAKGPGQTWDGDSRQISSKNWPLSERHGVPTILQPCLVAGGKKLEDQTCLQ